KLIDAVKIRLRSDVPLGFCMSGGVDSNSIIAIAKRLFNYDVEGFTIVNTDHRYEEKTIIDQVVKELNLAHCEVYLSKGNFLENLRALIKHHDAPVYTITYYVHWLLLKSFKQKGYKISLSGTAADELFSGYYDHHNFYFAGIQNNHDRYKEAVKQWRNDIGKIVRNPYLQDPDIFIKKPYERGHITLGQEQLLNYFNHPDHAVISDKFYTDRILRNRMLNEIFYETIPVILHEDDANAMYYSIENRSPFLDRHLFEHAVSIPDEYLIQNGVAKYILREAMRGIVPDIVLDQKRKTGFNAPIEDLIDTDDPKIKEQLLSDGPVWDILNKTMIEKHLSFKNLPNSMSKFLFSFISVKLFLEEYA
ncbi:MAG: asparagine synthase C-terminal domain-containing protein, partial [Pseudomonadota bacterium]